MKSASILLASLHLRAASAAPAGQTTSQSNGILTDASKIADKAFDYIIAGGGLTGLTVASRLSEDPDMSILVIEGGQDNHADPRVNDVRTYGQAFASDLDYNLTSTPIPWQNDTGLLLVAGKTLGGSGSINGASWTKGDKSQYDLLRMLTGDASWGFDSVNKLMLGAENFHEPTPKQVDKSAKFDSSVHGQGGPVEVSFAAGMFGGIQEPALQASEKVWKGLKRVADFAAGITTGTTIIPNMLHVERHQKRSSPFTAYAKHQVQQRSNFQILTGHRVVLIKWRESQEVIADGVTFQACATCKKHFVKAKREVLLAAGSLQSPQILELSGVGDPKILTAAGVPLKLASPGVGKNMQEQTRNTLTWTPKSTDFDGSGPPSSIAFANVDQVLGKQSASIYQDIVSGLNSYASDLESKGLVTSGSAASNILRAQIENLWKDKVGAAEMFYTTSPASGIVGVDLWNLIVLSRGFVHIISNNSWDHPMIEPSYFGHAFDLKIQVAACMQSRQVFQTEPLASLIANETLPGTAVAQDANAEVWEQWVKSTFTSVWHYIATLSMMKEELGGVVDSRLKVYGIKNVRAIDASVLPIQLSAHLSSSLYGIAEKAAAMIKEDQMHP